MRNIKIKEQKFSKMEPLHAAQFVLGWKKNTDSIFILFCREYSLQQSCSVHLKRHYLDSFDWRMYQKNYLCGWDEPINTSKTNLEGIFFVQNKETGDRIYEFPLSHIPKFSREVAHQACRRLLEDILDVRALMVMTTIMIKRKEFLLLNENNKTLAILHVENYSIHGKSDGKQLSGRLLVYPIRGYQKVFKQIINAVATHLKLPRANTALFDEALTFISHKPNPKRDNLITRNLASSLNTWEAAQILLKGLFEVMQANEPGLRDAIDTEFLHDYRVALRRSRSTLSQIKHILPDKLLTYFKREFFWLGTVTTPTRDLDIFLLKFDDYRQELSAELQRDLEPFRHFLEHHWKIEHRRMCQALDSKRYQRFISKWQEILVSKNFQLKSVPASSVETFNATKPARQVVSQQIWKLYNRVLKEGKAITPQSPDEELHELRKTCKKFRYLVEFFHDYYPDKQIKKLVKTLKQLQQNLGDFQDLSVQLEQLKGFAEQMRQEGVAEAKTIMAMGVLVEKLNERKALVRAEFSQCFKVFAKAVEKSAFARTFSPQI